MGSQSPKLAIHLPYWYGKLQSVCDCHHGVPGISSKLFADEAQTLHVQPSKILWVRSLMAWPAIDQAGPKIAAVRSLWAVCDVRSEVWWRRSRWLLLPKKYRCTMTSLLAAGLEGLEDSEGRCKPDKLTSAWCWLLLVNTLLLIVGSLGQSKILNLFQIDFSWFLIYLLFILKLYHDSMIFPSRDHPPTTRVTAAGTKPWPSPRWNCGNWCSRPASFAQTWQDAAVPELKPGIPWGGSGKGNLGFHG